MALNNEMENFVSNHGYAMKLEQMKNWLSCKFQIKAILRAVNIFELVDGNKLLLPENIVTWEQKDVKAMGILATGLSNNV